MPAMRIRLALITALVVLAWPAASVAPPAGASYDRECTAYAKPVYVHPGRPRAVHMACTGGFPSGATFEQPAHGTVVQTSAPNDYRYTPAAGYEGPDPFIVHPDGESGQPSGAPWPAATIEVTVTSTENIAPQCGGQSPQDPVVRAGKTIEVQAYCADREEDPFTYKVTAPPQHGTVGDLRRRSDGGVVFSYTAASDAASDDSLTIAATDDYGGAGQLTVPIHVRSAAENKAPSCRAAADPQRVTINVEWGVLSCWDPENDPMTLEVVEPPAHGKVRGSGPSILYRPDQDYAGPDHLSVRVTDDLGAASPVAGVNVSVQPPDPPACEDQEVDVAPRVADGDPGTPVDLRCPATAYLIFHDPPSHGPLLSSATSPSAIREGWGYGGYPGAPPLSIPIYQPEPGFRGIDVIHFSASTPWSGSVDRTITLYVGVPRQAPAPAPAPLIPFSPSARAKQLLRGPVRRFPLTHGVTAYRLRTGAAPSDRLAVVDCPIGCVLDVRPVLTVSRAAAKAHSARSKPLRLATRRIVARPGAPALLRLKLSSAQRHALARSRTSWVTLGVRGTVGTRRTSATRKLGVRPPR